MSIAMRQGIGSVIGQHRRGSLLENLEWEDSSDDGEEEKQALIAKANLLNVAGHGSGDEEKFEDELNEAKYNQGLDTMTIKKARDEIERLSKECANLVERNTRLRFKRHEMRDPVLKPKRHVGLTGRTWSICKMNLAPINGRARDIDITSVSSQDVDVQMCTGSDDGVSGTVWIHGVCKTLRIHGCSHIRICVESAVSMISVVECEEIVLVIGAELPDTQVQFCAGVGMLICNNTVDGRIHVHRSAGIMLSHAPRTSPIMTCQDLMDAPTIFSAEIPAYCHSRAKPSGPHLPKGSVTTSASTFPLAWDDEVVEVEKPASVPAKEIQKINEGVDQGGQGRAAPLTKTSGSERRILPEYPEYDNDCGDDDSHGDKAAYDTDDDGRPSADDAKDGERQGGGRLGYMRFKEAAKKQMMGVRVAKMMRSTVARGDGTSKSPLPERRKPEERAASPAKIVQRGDGRGRLFRDRQVPPGTEEPERWASPPLGDFSRGDGVTSKYARPERRPRVRSPSPERNVASPAKIVERGNGLGRNPLPERARSPLKSPGGARRISASPPPGKHIERGNGLSKYTLRQGPPSGQALRSVSPPPSSSQGGVKRGDGRPKRMLSSPVSRDALPRSNPQGSVDTCNRSDEYDLPPRSTSSDDGRGLFNSLLQGSSMAQSFDSDHGPDRTSLPRKVPTSGLRSNGLSKFLEQQSR